ncbi:MAG: hypothetical protein WCE44_14430 [Candidatus Velthaea sp.]|jgi:hypothetical protein
MKRFAFLTALVAVFAMSVPSLAQDHSSLAPADQYFGRMKMSILGIRNTIHDMDVRASYQAPSDVQYIYNKLLLVEDALHDWQAKYPHDTWIPKMTYGLAMVYKKLPLDDAQVHMNDQLDWLTASYPHSDEAAFPR